MKFLAIAMVLVCATIQTEAQGEATHNVQDLSWVAGKWEKQNTRPGVEGYEIWYWHSDGYLAGKGYTIKQGDTVFVETLKILEKDGDLFYVAEVSHNQEPTYFRITQASGGSFTSENPEHDFPKRIAYTLVGDELTATISDNEKEIPFVFMRSRE